MYQPKTLGHRVLLSSSVVRKNSYSEFILNKNSEVIQSINMGFHIHKNSEYEF